MPRPTQKWVDYRATSLRRAKDAVVFDAPLLEEHRAEQRQQVTYLAFCPRARTKDRISLSSTAAVVSPSRPGM